MRINTHNIIYHSPVHYIYSTIKYVYSTSEVVSDLTHLALTSSPDTVSAAIRALSVLACHR